MKLRPLTADEVEFELGCEEEFIPFEGNVLSSGDAALDKEAEDDVRRRLNRNDVSAWCILTVKAKWKGYTGHASLGCFIFPEGNTGPQNLEYAKDEYEQLRSEALDDLNQGLATSAKMLFELVAATEVVTFKIGGLRCTVLRT